MDFGSAYSVGSSGLAVLNGRDLLQMDLEAWDLLKIGERLDFYGGFLVNLSESSVLKAEVLRRIENLKQRQELVRKVVELEERVSGMRLSFSVADLRELRGLYADCVTLIRNFVDQSFASDVNLDSSVISKFFGEKLASVDERILMFSSLPSAEDLNIRAFEQSFDDLKDLYSRLIGLERQLTTQNYETLISKVLDLRKKFCDRVAYLKRCLAEQGDKGEIFADFVAFAGAVVGEDVCLSVVDGDHALVQLRVRLIEAWFRVKRTEKDNPLFFERKLFFLNLLEEALGRLRTPLDFGGMYELFADDFHKLKSLVVSFFQKRNLADYVKEFNGFSKENFSDATGVSLLLKEFSLYFIYQKLD